MTACHSCGIITSTMNTKKLYQNPEWLRAQYHDGGLTYDEIGKQVGLTGCAIGHWMRRYNIPARAGGPRTPRSYAYRNAAWLRTKYWDEKFCVREMAELCGCSQAVILRWMKKHDIKRRSRASNTLPLGEAGFNEVLRNYQRHARDRGLAWQLTREQFRTLTQQPCHYCGLLPSQILSRTKYNGVYIHTGVDRASNRHGYTPDNCVPCCTVCNRAKMAQTVAEFEKWIRQAFAHLEATKWTRVP